MAAVHVTHTYGARDRFLTGCTPDLVRLARISFCAYSVLSVVETPCDIAGPYMMLMGPIKCTPFGSLDHSRVAAVSSASSFSC
jgi:hypothetical protein